VALSLTGARAEAGSWTGLKRDGVLNSNRYKREREEWRPSNSTMEEYHTAALLSVFDV
jgi:hypothetical protein